MTLKRKITLAISWLLVAVCMTIIFYLSAQVASESAQTSLGMMSFLEKIFTGLTELIGHDAFRSIAHGLEYCGLALLLFNALYHTFTRPRALLSFAVSVLYAVSDEIHQIFVEGRAFQLTDIAVDAVGSLVGVAAGFVIYKAIIIIQKTQR